MSGFGELLLVKLCILAGLICVLVERYLYPDDELFLMGVIFIGLGALGITTRDDGRN